MKLSSEAIVVLNGWNEKNPNSHGLWPLFCGEGDFIGTVDEEGWLEPAGNFRGQNFGRQVKFNVADVGADGKVWIHAGGVDIAVLRCNDGDRCEQDCLHQGWVLVNKFGDNPDDNYLWSTWRMRVPNGWLYRHVTHNQMTVTFVPGVV